MDRLVSYQNNPQWQLINHTHVTFYQICPAVMLAIWNIWSIKIIDLNPSNARGLEVMSAKHWRRDLTWLRVRVPSRRLAETWGHEYIVLGNCKGAKNVYCAQHTNQCVHYKHENREEPMDCYVNKWPYLNVGVEMMRFFPFWLEGNRFLLLYLNLKDVQRAWILQ